MVAALIGLCSGVLVVLLGLLIAMLTGLGKRVEKITESLTLKLDCDEYKEDKKSYDFKLAGFSDRVLRLEITARVVSDEVH